ncbi:MAG: 2Fe-2S iron-sulfur cluster-binding protein [Pseudomonadota bacterium]
MIKITFVQPDGQEVDVTANAGDSVMQTALAHNVDGITAECNGSAACATCHAFFSDDLIADLPEMEEHENDLLDFAACERQTGSRLSCQIKITERLNGEQIVLPEAQ